MVKLASALIETVLVVDDEPAVLRALERVLRDQWFRVLKVSTGEEALQALADNEIAVMICDQHLPDLTGVEVLQQAMEISPHTTRVILTGDVDRNVAVNAVNDAQVTHFIPKPWDDKVVRQTIQACVDKYRLLKENQRLQSKISVQHEQLLKQHEVLRNDLDVGAGIHEVLLTGKVEGDVKGLDVAVCALSAKEIAGDFCDFYRPSAGILDLVVGDVMGKGIPAALVGTALKMQLHRFALPVQQTTTASPQHGWKEDLMDPSEILGEVQQSLTAQLIELGYFASLFYARFDTVRREISYIDSGFTKPIHYRPAADCATYLQGENFPVGVIENDRYQEKTQHYDEKDLFVFYSDGVTEATDSSGEMFGTERIIDIIRLNAEVPAKALLHLIKQSLIRFVGEDKFDDDVTIIVVKATQEALIEDDCYHSARFNSDFSQLEAVRGFVDRMCQNTPGDREQLSQQLQLVINEAFANIVEHSYSGQSGHTIIVNLCLKEEGVFIELLDQGESFQPDAVSEPSLAGDQSDGFGVYIIREMTDSVSYQPRRSASGWNHLRLYKKYCIQGESMEFTHEKENEVLVVTLNGDNLDAREAPKFKETMSKLIGEEQVANVVFDLDRLKFIDSSGLGSILSVLRLANNQGGDVKLASMTKPIQAMFEVVRMHKLFEIYHTKEDAVNSFVKRCNG